MFDFKEARNLCGLGVIDFLLLVDRMFPSTVKKFCRRVMCVLDILGPFFVSCDCEV